MNLEGIFYLMPSSGRIEIIFELWQTADVASILNQ